LTFCGGKWKLIKPDQTRSFKKNSMTVNSITEAKTNLSALIAKVCEGQEIIIGRAGKPVAVLVPYSKATHARKPGSLSGKVRMSKDFDAPLPYDIAAAFGA
jgi:prevent-host-death family protein